MARVASSPRRRCLSGIGAAERPVAIRVSRAGGEPMGLAGLWASWRSATGELLASYTFNADDHQLINFPKPREEKLMVVVLNDDSYGAWLQAPVERSNEFLRQYPAERLVATAG